MHFFHFFCARACVYKKKVVTLRSRLIFAYIPPHGPKRIKMQKSEFSQEEDLMIQREFEALLDD